MARRPLIALLPLLLLTACSDDGSAPPPAADGPAEILPAAPDGMMLPGEAGDPARPAATLLPTPADPADVDEDGLLRSRLTAIVAPAATVGAVNAVLAAHGAAVNSMAAGSPLLTLTVPARADLAAVQALADSLAGTDAIALAWPARAPRRPAVVESALAPPAKRFPPHGDALDYLDHLFPARIPGMWSAGQAIRIFGTARLILAVPFPADGDLTEIPNLRFPENGGERVTIDQPVEHDIAAWGLHLAGIAAADWTFADGRRHTGVDPETDMLDLVGVSTHNLSFGDLMILEAAQQPQGRMVLLSVEYYHDPDHSVYSGKERVYDALHWRFLVHETIGGTDFVHVVPAGHRDESGATAFFDSPYDLAGVQHLDAAALLLMNDDDFAFFESHFADLLQWYPFLDQPVDNVLTVGASDWLGDPLPSTNPEANVRMVGQNVPAPCGLPYWCGNGESRRVTANAAAAAQVAGLAAYLWHLDPDLNAQDVLTRLQHAYSAAWTPGVLDGWIAAFSADTGLTPQTARARMALLDVDSNLAFDDDDVASFVDAFAQLQGNDRLFTRWDLNGDGRTGGAGTAPVDLDVNVLPGFTTVSQDHGGLTATYDERNVTDLEVLCYYAWSPLYTGDEDRRAELLPDCGGDRGATGLTYAERTNEALAYVGGRIALGERTDTGTGTFASTVSRDTTVDTGTSYSGAASATSTHLSSFTQDEEGRLTGITGNGSADVTIAGTWPARLAKREDVWRVQGTGAGRFVVEFDVTDGDVPFTLDFRHEADRPDTLVDTYVIVSLEGDEEGEVVWYEPEYDVDGTPSWNGVLVPDSYRLVVEYTLAVEADDGDHRSSVNLEAGGSWNLDLSLSP